ncbi:glutamine-hydrolyzing carbamoyl-phosphate synthase small subunit [bacterium]|nr:glutamine-hydrolyzing carbamoyl-phosphate synthase small subunit [bacterium]
MKINEKIKEKIVLALDVDNIDDAKAMIMELKDYVGVFKVGLQLYTANGGEIFKFMNEQNIKFFFDIKLCDIPNTVAKASENVVRNGATFFNIHAMGGSEMMKASVQAAKKAAEELGKPAPTILAVTLLTSINEEMLSSELKVSYKTTDYALNLALNAQRSGLDGVVASVWEAKQIKQICGKDFKVLCPGIRPEWASSNDQKRLATPKAAIKEGADYLVIGRAVTSAENRLEAIQRIYDEIENAILTQNESYSTSKAKILLENGMIFEGESFGADTTSFGELVFNTSMVGYQEIMTDPSYSQQMVVMTYPEIGNYGINREDSESGKIYVRGLIVKNICAHESHYKSICSLSDYLKQNNIIGISNVDTRGLTQVIRDYGSMKCVMTTGPVTKELKEELEKYEPNRNIVQEVTTYKTERIAGSGAKLALVDFGVKKSIISDLKELNCDITIFPADVSSKELLEGNFDAVLFSNGPGNPKDVECAILCAKELLGKIKLYGICLGHQILALALGADTYKLKYGHRGGNHPVINLETNKVYISSQNHSYAVDENSLPEGVRVTYKNLNDGTIEGLKCEKYNIETVQFHPERASGPYDTNTIFYDWVSSMDKTILKV